MKIRNGFVSNSSSSSFILNKQCLSTEQIEQVKNHIAWAWEKGWIPMPDASKPWYMNGGILGVADEWKLEENEYEIIGHTSMDNFNMEGFLWRIGVPEKFIHIEKCG